MRDDIHLGHEGYRYFSCHAALQFTAALVVLGIAWPFFFFRQQPLPWFEASSLIGATALLFAYLSGASWWWRVIHSLFAPAAYAFLQLSINPSWYLLAFTTLFLVYRGALSGQIPLYFSNRKSASALVNLFADKPPAKIIDLGAGIGSMVCPLAKAFKGSRVFGIESAYLPWLVGRLRTSRLKNCRWTLGNFWEESLADYDVVYAFLSPAPMTNLWLKITREMRSGSLFISNSFPVLEQDASFVIDIPDARKTRLFCYRI